MKKKTKTIKTPAPAKPAAKPRNMLYIRGVGPGLSWEKGQAMTCMADELWATSLADAAGPVVCKFLINDLIWCAGDDFVVTPGTKAVLTPIF
jgi:hypothetical protein